MIYIQLSFVLLCIIEALHDKAVIELQNYQHTKYDELSKSWHNLSAAHYSIVVCITASLAGSWLLIIPLFLIRLTIFNLMLNLFRGMPLFHLSNTGFDANMKTILGPDAGLIQFLVGLIIIATINLNL